MKERLEQFLAKTKSEKIYSVLNILLMVLLIGSIAFSALGLLDADTEQKSRYLLIIVQICIGISALFIPTVAHKKFNLKIPIYLRVILVVFIYLAVFLGEVSDYYYKVPFWDTILHTFSGFIFAIISLSIINLLNDNKSVHLQMSPLFVALFAFCFAVALGVLWEIVEFSMDNLLGLNSQKFIPETTALFNGGNSFAPLAGTDGEIAAFFRQPSGYKYALEDTMGDLIVDCLGALVASVLDYIILKYKTSKYAKLIITKDNHSDDVSMADTSATGEEKLLQSENEEAVVQDSVLSDSEGSEHTDL